MTRGRGTEPVVALEVEWHDPAPTQFDGRCATAEYSGPVRLDRHEDGGRIRFPGDVPRLRGRAWSLDGRPMPGALRTSRVPASEWGAGSRSETIVIVTAEVPSEVTDELADRFGIAPIPLYRRWLRMPRQARREAMTAWQAEWASRHGRPWRHWTELAREAAPIRPLDRDERIAAAIRTYTGRRTLRRRWPWLRPLRRHAGMPDITAADRKRVCRQLEGERG